MADLILNGKIFISNCDSTRKLSSAEIQHRLLVSILFAEGIICSPNHLLDNLDALALLKNKTLNRWYNEEGHGSIIIRSPIDIQSSTLSEYYLKLPEDHYFHSVEATKSEMSDYQKTQLLRAIEAFDQKIAHYGVKFERAAIQRNSLQSAIKASLTTKDQDPLYGTLNKKLYHDDFDATELISRSHWYAYIRDNVVDPIHASKIKLELIDSNYNNLFVNEGEAYAMDRIAHLSLLPTKILNFGVAIKTFKKEYQSLRSMIRAFEVISTFGTMDLTKLLTNAALNAIEDSAEKSGYKWATRKNWFGLYNTLTSKIGIEVK